MQRPITYPELVLGGPMAAILDTLRKGTDPADAHEMAQRVAILATVSGVDKDLMSRSDLDAYLYWAVHRWERSRRPVFTLEGELAWAVAHTEPPTDKFDLLAEIPVEGMYVTVPPVFDIGDDEVGRHRIEGLFLTTNEVYVPRDNAQSEGALVRMTTDELNRQYRPVRGITVVGIGEDKAPDLAGRIDRGEGWRRDDWVVYFNIVPGLPLYLDGASQGVVELTRVVYNLLYLLQNTTEIREEVEPTRPELEGEGRKPRRERERQNRKGRSAYPHRVWHLSTLDRGRTSPDPDAPVERNTVPKVSGHVVLGHIHRYWVLDPAGRKSLATREVHTKTRGTRTYHLVARWLLPYVRGEGPVASPRVLVR